MNRMRLDDLNLKSIRSKCSNDHRKVQTSNWRTKPENLPLRELLERRPDHRSRAEHTVPAGLDVGQITANHTIRLDDGLSSERMSN